MSDTGIPDSARYREIQEILRTFRDSSWRSITLDLHGVRVTLGKDGPPAHDRQSGPEEGGFPPRTDLNLRSSEQPADRTGVGVAPDGRAAQEDQQEGPDRGGISPRTGHDRRPSPTAAPAPAVSAATAPGATADGPTAGGAAADRVPAGAAATGAAASGVTPTAVDTTGCVEVRSPAVGAFWTAPSPGQLPFVQVGQTVAADEQLAIVEVMKLMNPVVAPVAGEVVSVNAANADLVEYEQVLFWIRPGD